MTEYLLDANVVIDWLKGIDRVVHPLGELASRGEVLAANAVSVAETYSSLSDRERQDAEPMLDTLEYWLIDLAVARLAGVYRYRYARLGRPLPVADTLMAAHAISRDAVLLTANVRDFPMPELKLQPLP